MRGVELLTAKDYEIIEKNKNPERIAEAIYVSDEKDKIDAKTRKMKEEVFARIEDLKNSGQKVNSVSDFIALCIDEKEEN